MARAGGLNRRECFVTRLRRLVLLAFIPGIILVGSWVIYARNGEHFGADANPVDRKEQWWIDRHKSFVERATKGDVNVLFLGDSLTHGWENAKEVWERSFSQLHAAEFGIQGDQSQHVLWRIKEGKELEGIHPRVVVLLIGVNDLAEGKTPGETAKGIAAVVRELRRQRPGANILLLGIFPHGQTAISPLRAKIKQVNERIANLDDARRVHYIDFGVRFLDKDGNLTNEIAPDFVHLSSKGYQIYADEIRPILEDLLRK